MRRLLPLLLVAAAAAPARADSDLSIGSGAALSHVGPDPAALLSIQWASHRGHRNAILLRAEGLFATDRLPGDPMKGSAFGIDAGVRRRVSSTGTVAYTLAATAGPRLFLNPGIGAAARLSAAAHMPITFHFFVTATLGAEAGYARYGDSDLVRHVLHRRADLTLALTWYFGP